MLDKLEALHNRWKEIEQQLNEPDVMSDMKRYVKLNRDYKDLQPVVEKYLRFVKLESDLTSAKEVLYNEKDEEFRALAKEEIQNLTEEMDLLEEEIKILLIPSDPQDTKNAILEIRAGTGGDEASIFAGDLFRMYTKYCETKRWKIELVDYTEGTVGGYKEIIANVTGEKVYRELKYESGVHRVQRVPQTETQGRVHTSAATVAVLPEADEFDVEIKPEDIRKDTYCSSGPGGQSVNTTYSAVRLVHIPTGIVVRVRIRSRRLGIMKRLCQYCVHEEQEYQKYLDEHLKTANYGCGDRSAKIRTYNYHRVITDHRIGLSVYNPLSLWMVIFKI